MPDNATVEEYVIEFQPLGRRVRAKASESLLAAAQSAGVELSAICGGMGNCGGCKVRLMHGECSPLTLDERAVLVEVDIDNGWRLACQALPCSDAVVDIPPESLTTLQRLQIEGQETDIPLDPIIQAVAFQADPPRLDDLRADLIRFKDALAIAGHTVRVHDELLASLSARLRQAQWQGTAVVRAGVVIDLLEPGSPVLGLAVDAGTTKLAAYLVDLTTGATLAREGSMNPQIAYGEDVISRIHYCNQHSAGRDVLQKAIVGTLNEMAARMCAHSGYRPEQVYEAVIVGNTAMHHLLAGLPVKQLGASPFVPAVSESIELNADRLGLAIHPHARVYLPPNIAGFVGADHVAMLLASQFHTADRTTLALDIGTNTEISLKSGQRIVSCSCASGPAFEGAHISAGMRAAPGAIERVSIHEGKIRTRTIGNQPAVGICGSGILDAVAELLLAGAVDPRGNLIDRHPLVQTVNGKREVILTGSTERQVAVTRADINEVQLAKGAIRAGIEVLLQAAGIRADEIDDFIIAGAFGTYLSVQSALAAGMFPPLPAGRFRQVGNAAGAGALQMLISTEMRAAAEQLAQSIEYIELTTHRTFSREFYQSIMFQPPKQECI